jgi:hypothetical protein
MHLSTSPASFEKSRQQFGGVDRQQPFVHPNSVIQQFGVGQAEFTEHRAKPQIARRK